MESFKVYEGHTKFQGAKEFDMISDNSNDAKVLFKLIDSILTNSEGNILPDHKSENELAERFNPILARLFGRCYRPGGAPGAPPSTTYVKLIVST